MPVQHFILCRMKRISFLILVLCNLVYITACFAASDDGFRPLLKKNNLNGWTFDVLDDSPPESIFTLKDGILHINGKDKSTAVIRTKRTFSDYELKWEWRWPDEPGNSGCLIHCSAPRERNIWPKSLEVQMAHEKAGDFIYIGETIDVTPEQVPQDIPEGSWMVRLRNNLTDGSEKAPGEWNQGHLIVKGDTVTVHINGELVNSGWNCSATKGAICFQSEKANIQYRNILIKE